MKRGEGRFCSKCHMPSSHAGTHTSFVLDVMMNRCCRCGSRKFPFLFSAFCDEPSEWRCDQRDGVQDLLLVSLLIVGDRVVA
jgi:hypothetical protein